MYLRNKLNGLMLVLASVVLFQCHEEEEKDLPLVSALTINNVTSTSAQVVSLVNDEGSKTVISRGICVGTESGPTTQSTIVTMDGEGLGSYNSEMSDLAPGTKYYIRAYATSSLGTAYSNELTLTTLNALSVISTSAPTNIEPTSLVSGGTISSDGGAEVTARGVCWSTGHNPTNELSTKTFNGSGTGDFSSEVTGLQPGTTYYIRAFATNALGTSYGNEIEVVTPPILPVIETQPATNVLATNAGSGGNITYDGGAAIVARGVCWSTSPSPMVALATTTIDGTGTGSFASNITGLTPSTTYYIRAYATNSAGTAYGSEITITTIAMPLVQTKDVTNITANSAKSGGVILSDGGDPVTAFGVCWSTSPAPTVELETKTTDGSGIQNFSSQLVNLTTEVTYYVRAYATNRAGTAYGNEIAFVPVGLSVSDVDGNLYRMVQIGVQIWMGENLRTTRYRDGSSIAEVATAASFYVQTSGTYVAFNPNLSGNSRPLERLYNFFAVADPRNLCPTGTHVPTNTEWETLTAYAGGDAVAGAKLMESGTDYWSNAIGTNDYSFTARPAHIVNTTTVELSSLPRTWAAWWTSTAVSSSNAHWRAVGTNSIAISGSPADNPSGVPKNWGVSVRCIKD